MLYSEASCASNETQQLLENPSTPGSMDLPSAFSFFFLSSAQQNRNTASTNFGISTYSICQLCIRFPPGIKPPKLNYLV